MEDTNFVILNIRLFLKFLREGRHCIADITKKCCWFSHNVWGRKMNLVEKLLTAMNEELPIVIINTFETASTVKGYHVYQGIWVPKIGEHYQQKENPVILKANTLSA